MEHFKTYTFKPIESGNTFTRKRIGTDFDFTDVVVEVTHLKQVLKVLTLSNGLTKDGQGFYINPFDFAWAPVNQKPPLKWPPGEYAMEVTFTRADGVKRTYLKLIQKVTD